LTGAVTEMAKQMTFHFALPIFEIFRALAFQLQTPKPNAG